MDGSRHMRYYAILRFGIYDSECTCNIQYNATENALPIWENPLYDSWLKKQAHIREIQGDDAYPTYTIVKNN